MSMMAMVTPTPYTGPFHREFSWDDARSSDFASSRPRTEPERIALPSIRQAFPELQLRLVPPEASARASPPTTSPVMGAPGISTPPEYVHSPSPNNKRRRLSLDEDKEERASRVPRLYTSPLRSIQTGRPMDSPTLAPRSATDSWASSQKTSPYLPTSAGFPPMRSPAAMEPAERVERKPTLPSLPQLNFERDPAPMPPVRIPAGDEYAPPPAGRPLLIHPHDAARPPVAFGQGHPPPQQQAFPFPSAYHHPSRVQSLSLGSIHSFDRSPFPSAGGGGYGGSSYEYMRMGEFGGVGLNGDNKQRKRRGNLPKETTDKLRAWFVAHLHHPYPTEDEKQDLMRQTGLQMNQISNWFINARRRQLPLMIMNARAESNATSSGHGGEDKVLPSMEQGDYDDGKQDSPISDDGRHGFEDELSALSRHRAGHMKRGSV